MTDLYWRDVEGPLRSWLKAHAALASLTDGGRYVYFEAPDIPDRPNQWLTLRRLGGGPQPSHTPMDDALISFECWGRTKLAASSLAEAVVNVVQAIRQPVAVSNKLDAMHGQVVLWRWEPDGTVQPPLPRVVVDAAILFRVSSPV